VKIRIRPPRAAEFVLAVLVCYGTAGALTGRWLTDLWPALTALAAFGAGRGSAR
jgi:hypothetical protein